MCSLLNIIDKLWPVFVAVLTTQYLTQKFIETRKPKLEMVPEGIGTSRWIADKIYTNHIWRITVRHVKINKHIRFLVKNRDSALQCRADLTFYNLDYDITYTLQGRWANSMEPSFVSPSDRIQKIIYPDRIDIGYHDSEPLDCIVQYDDELNIAYCWNNESYAMNGRNARYKLETGNYKVKVKLSGQNFPQLSAEFYIVISKDWNGTSLTTTKQIT